MSFTALTLLAGLALPGADIPTPAPTSQPSESPDLHPVELLLVKYTNIERQRHNVPPLEVDVSLLKSSRAHASWMATHRTLRHASTADGENIAMGQATALEAIRSWMRSPGHRANLLSRSYRKLGVTGYVTPGGRIYWCQQFRR